MFFSFLPFFPFHSLRSCSWKLDHFDRMSVSTTLGQRWSANAMPSSENSISRTKMGLQAGTGFPKRDSGKEPGGKEGRKVLSDPVACSQGCSHVDYFQTPERASGAGLSLQPPKLHLLPGLLLPGQNAWDRVGTRPGSPPGI